MILSRRLVTYRVGDLMDAGFTLLATGQRPHYTVVLTTDGDHELGRLLACLGEPQDNQYCLAQRPGPHGRTR